MSQSSTEKEAEALFEALEDLERRGAITADQYEFFSYKARALVQNLASFRMNEERLGQAEKSLREKVEAQKEGMRRITELQMEDSGEISRLNRDVARRETDGVECKEREVTEQSEIERLEAEKALLQEEVDMHRQQQDTVLQPKLQALRKANEELQEGVEHDKELLSRLVQERDSVAALIERGRAAKEAAETELQAVSKEVAKSHAKPDHVRHQVEQLEGACGTMASDARKVGDAIEEAEKEEKEVRRQIGVTEGELQQQAEQYEKLRAEIDGKERLGEKVIRELEEEKSRGTELHGNRGALELQEKHLNIDLRRAEDRVSSKRREFARQVKHLQRVQAEAEATRRALPDLERLKAEKRKELALAEEAQKSQRGVLEGARLELDSLIHALLSEQELQVEVRAELEKTAREIEDGGAILKHLEDQEKVQMTPIPNAPTFH